MSTDDIIITPDNKEISEQVEVFLNENEYPEIQNPQTEIAEEDLKPSGDMKAEDIPGHKFRRNLLKSQGLLRIKDSEWIKRINLSQQTGRIIHKMKTEETIKSLEESEKLHNEKRKNTLIEIYGEERGIIEFKKEQDRKQKRLEKKLNKGM